MPPQQPTRLSPRRAAATGVRAHWDLVAIQELSRAAGDSEPNARGAIVKAHDVMAQQLQFAIAQALEDAIAARGPARNQRETGLLMKAIVDRRTRAANVTGFTVGNIEALGPPVSQYYRNLEIGTSVFVGRRLVGMFQDTRGRLIPATSERSRQVDPRLVQFTGAAASASRSEVSRDTGETRAGINRNNLNMWGSPITRNVHEIIISHPIKPYRYFAEGTKGFREEGGKLMVDLYVEEFEAAGIDFWARWLSRTGTAAPRVSDVSMRLARGKAARISS